MSIWHRIPPVHPVQWFRKELGRGRVSCPGSGGPPSFSLPLGSSRTLPPTGPPDLFVPFILSVHTRVGITLSSGAREPPSTARRRPGGVGVSVCVWSSTTCVYSRDGTTVSRAAVDPSGPTSCSSPLLGGHSLVPR